MPDPILVSHLVHFGAFEVDLRSAELRKHGLKLKIQEQPFQVLAMLLEHPGQVVTREELHKKLWPADTFVDFEHGLNAAINKLREALGDSADNPRFVETLHRRGYRFIAPVETMGAQGGAPAVAPTPSSPIPVAAMSPSPTVGAVREPLPGAQRRRRVPLRMIAAGSGVAVVIVAVLLALNVASLRDRVLRAVGAVREPPLQIQSIAVLPLANLSGDPAQEYFADGMTDELITVLGQIEALRVISRTSVMLYKGVKKPLPQIARELNVGAVVEGTVLRSGNRVRISAQLIQANPEKHLWAESYERDLGDVLALQSEVAGAIANEIKIKVTPQEQARLASARPANPDAHEAYLKGRFYWNLRTEEGVKKSMEYFQQAIDKDPGYALAYAGLADSYILLGEWNFTAPKETYPRAEAAALKALEMDETLGEAHVSLGAARRDYDWDWVGAEKEFKRALELNPGYATAHQWYAEYLSAMGRHNEALAEAKRAQELDPLSPIINAYEGMVFFNAHRYDEAIAQLRNTLELNAGFYPAHYYLGVAYEQEERYAEAISEYQKAIALQPGDRRLSLSLACVYAAEGNRAEAVSILSQMEQLSMRRYVPSYTMALAYAALGDTDRAFARLEKAYEHREIELVFLKVYPPNDRLRSDRRFHDLLHRMNFPP
jgi:TolB-like protein/DNA-binding winged helix-turn-helix (wHTH) protein/Flp pilus assembly protein TadD